MKIKNKLIIILCFILMISCFGFIGVNADNVKNSNVTQEEYEFFGKWNGFSWAIESQLNYELPALKSIETRVKMGDYDNAKELLFGYYKTRESFKGIDYGPASSDAILKADLTLRDIMNGSGVAIPVDFLEIETGKKWYSYDVYSAISVGNKEVFTFIAMGKQDNLVTFDSKEGINKPYLDITVNGQNSIIYPVEDTFVRAGKYDTVSYGGEKVLEVNDTGFPFDDNTRRTTMIFDLSGLSGKVSSAKIFLYGGSTNGTVDVMAYKAHDSAWVEETHSWVKESSYLFSWETSEEGTDWRTPESGTQEQWDRMVGGMGLISDLVSAYVATDEDKYAIKAVDLVLDYIKDAEGNVQFPDVLRTGQRAKFLPQFINYMVKTDFLDSESFFKILYFTYQHIELLNDPSLEYAADGINVANFHPSANWGVTEAAGAFASSNFLPELKRYEKDNVLIQYRIQQILDLCINDDGSYNEDNTGYPIAVLHDFMFFLEVGLSNNLNLPATFIEQMRLLGKWIMDFSSPIGTGLRYGDGGQHYLKDRIENLGRLLNDSEQIYFGTNGKEGTAPEYTSIFYPDMDTAMMRSGWEASSLYAHINTHDGTHCHHDQNAIIMYAYGRELLIDPGVKSYNSNDPINQWQVKDHEAHNTFKLLDVPTPGRLVNFMETQLWQTNAGADVYKGYHETFMDAPHTRTVLMVKPNFFIVSDYAKNVNGRSKRYQLNWNLFTGANPSVDSTTKKAVTNFVNGANLQIIPADASMSVSIKQGYFSNQGNTTRNPIIGYDKTSTADFNVSTVLYPTKEGQSKNVMVSNIALNHGMKNAMRINFDGTLNNDIAYYYITNESVPTSTSFTDNGVSFTTDSGLFYYQQSKNNAPVNFILSCGSEVVKDGVSIVDSPSKIASLTVGYSSDSLNLSGDIVACTDKTKAIKIYAPNVTQVTINGQSVAFEREGDYIYAAMSSEIQEVQELMSMINDLPALDSMTGENVDELISLKVRITRFLLKGCDVSNISNYDYFVKAQNIAESLISLDDLIFRMKYLPDINDITSNTLWKYGDQIKKLYSIATELQENLGDGYPIVQEQIDKLNVYVQKIEELASLRVIYNSLNQYSFTQGENNWYNYYQILEDSNLSKVGLLSDVGYASTGVWLQIENNAMRLANEFLKPTKTSSPVKMWIAPKSGTIKINLTVNAYYNSYLGNGYTAILTKNELPFVNDGTSRAKINTNAIYTKYIEPLDPIRLKPEYHTFELVCYVEKGDYLALSVDPNEDDALTAADYMEYDLNIEFFVGVELNSIVEFNEYNDLYNRIDEIPVLEKLTILDKEDVFALYDEIVAYGKDKFSNVKKLEDAVAKLNGMSNESSCIVQVFVNGEGEIILDKSSVNIGDVVTINLVPEEGYEYKEGSLTVNGETQDSLSFVITEKVTIVICDFEPIKYKVQTENNGHAKVHLSSTSAGVGEKVYFFIETDYGYMVKNYKIKLNGEEISGNHFIVNDGQNVLSFEVVEISVKESNLGLIIGISAGAVAIAAAGVVTFILLKKKRIGKKSV